MSSPQSFSLYHTSQGRCVVYIHKSLTLCAPLKATVSSPVTQITDEKDNIMKSIELTRINNVSTVAILRDDNSFKEFVVCYDYDKTKPFGEQWNNGHYTESLILASEFFRALNNNPTYSRMEEIATVSLHILEDYELIEDADDDLALEVDEYEYFDIKYPYSDDDE